MNFYSVYCIIGQNTILSRIARIEKGVKNMCRGIKKFLITFLAVICFASLAFAVACTDKTWYSFTIIACDGVTVESEVQSGAQVQAGYEIKFTLVLAENAVGEPAVTVNEQPLNADAQGVYSFKVSENTIVEITGVSVSGACDIEFGLERTTENGKERYLHEWVRFTDEDGKELSREGMQASYGETIRFKVDVSKVYFGECNYNVTAGSAILVPDSDGYYTYTVTGKQSVLVKGLPTDAELIKSSFIGRPALDANGNPILDSAGEEIPEGVGSENRPYLIKTPFDLYFLSVEISDASWRSSVMSAHYRLENDIDMQGERLYVIGNNPDGSSAFAGTFDGNGKTIRNYYMTDTLYYIESNIEVHLPVVGLFGFATSSADGSAGIYNLNLENFTITANAAKYGEPVYVGAVVGYGAGANISNCSASGSITVDGDTNYFAYAGGIIGCQQSAFMENVNTRYYSLVQSCSSDVDIRCDSGFIYSAGGITGYLITFEERTTAAILNCYSEGDIAGAIRVGGIAGSINSYSSIKNCYATGAMSATTRLTLTDIVSQDKQLAHAYAGGITGYAEYGSVVSDSFFTGTVGARAVAGSWYAHTGSIAGGKDETGKTELVHVDGALIYNCASENTTVNDGYIKGTLGWSNADWAFSSNGLPKINKAAESKSFTVTVKVGSDTKATLNITDNYIPLSYWYYDAQVNENKEGTLPEFLGTGAQRTYGYFFDSGLTMKVPFGYVFTDNITIYAGYANYNMVAGDYYFQNGGDKHFTLTDDGYLFYYDGALNSVSTYVYNGEYLVLNNTFFAIAFGGSNEFYSFKAELKDGVMTIYDKSFYPESKPLKALKKVADFSYGTYYDEDGVEYIFNADGTGSRGTSPFVYEVNGNVIKTISGITGTVENGVVKTFGGKGLTAYDNFKGVWEKSATTYRQYSFDGKGNWSYNGYDSEETLRGTYTKIDGYNSIRLSNGKTATYEDGVITIDGIEYYAVSSYVGTWLLNLDMPIEVTFEGIGKNGFGSVHVDYGTDYSQLDLTYQADVNADGKVYLTIYNYYDVYGYLTFDEQAYTLTGSFYRADKKAVVDNVRFCLYDDYKGKWSGNGLELTFNGLGRYDLPGAGTELMKTYGSAIVNGDKTGRVIYTLTDSVKATFTYDKKTYNLEYDEAADVIYLSIDGGESFMLTRS